MSCSTIANLQKSDSVNKRSTPDNGNSVQSEMNQSWTNDTRD